MILSKNRKQTIVFQTLWGRTRWMVTPFYAILILLLPVFQTVRADPESSYVTTDKVKGGFVLSSKGYSAPLYAADDDSTMGVNFKSYR